LERTTSQLYSGALLRKILKWPVRRHGSGRTRVFWDVSLYLTVRMLVARDCFTRDRLSHSQQHRSGNRKSPRARIVHPTQIIHWKYFQTFCSRKSKHGT